MGQDTQTGLSVELSDEARALGLYVLGTPGTGKSTLMLNMVMQDLLAGHGLCVIDPHGQLIDDILERVPSRRQSDIVILDPTSRKYAFGLNLFEPLGYDDVSITRQKNLALGVFQSFWSQGMKGDSWGPQLEHFLSAVTMVLLHNPGYAMTDIPGLVIDPNIRKGFLQGMPEYLTNFWRYDYPQSPTEQRHYRDSTMNKIRPLIEDPLLRHIVGQATSTVSVADIMARQKVLLVRLDTDLQQELVTTLGGIIIALIRAACFGRGFSSPFFALYADEFHLYSTPYFAEMILGGRKFNMATTVAHQSRGSFSRDNPNRHATLAVRNKILFQVTPGTDSKEMADHLVLEPELLPSGQQPILSVHPKPLEYLKSHPTDNEQLRTVMINLVQTIENDMRRPLPERATHDRHYDPVVDARHHDAEMTKVNLRTFLDMLNGYVYTLMKGEDGSRERTNLLQYAEHINEDPRTPMGLRMLGEYLTEAFAAACVGNPTMVPTGEHEELLRPEPLTQAKQKAEIRLSQLPRYQAIAILDTEGTLTQYELATNPKTKPNTDSYAQRSIYDTNRMRYYRKRKDVEEEIANRLPPEVIKEPKKEEKPKTPRSEKL